MRKLTVNKEGMSRLSKRIQQAKRVAPPAVPEVYRHSGSSFSSAGYGSCDDTSGANVSNYYTAGIPSDASNTVYAASSRNSTNSTSSLDQTDGAMNRTLQSNPPTNTGVASNANSPQPQVFMLHQQPLTHKVAVYYHQQLALQEDQGIDLTQSPGRDSPGSSSGSAGSGSRHSTASLDSGRASSYHTGTSMSSVTSKRIVSGGVGCNIGIESINNLGGGILSSPRCSSVSSCSIGSADNMSQRSDHEIITDWLRELCFDEYAPLFSEAGYDMPTISRMTPEDLTAIGIKKPRHRERIKQHIDSLQLPDNLPHYVPGSIEEWLRLLRLEEYVQPLLAQGYRTVRDVTQLPWEDMEDIGIVKLGHQKKILLAIKRIKDILSGKWIAPGIANSPQDCMQMMMNWDQQPQQYYEQRHLMNPMPSHLSPLTTDSNINNQFYQQISYHQTHPIKPHSNLTEKDNNDIVLIKLRQPRGRSLESLEDSDEKRSICTSHLTFSQHHTNQGDVADENLHEPSSQIASVAGQYQLANSIHHMCQQSWRQYVDGDITPTNEMCSRSGRDISNLPCDIDLENTTMLRHRSISVPQRAKPIAMVKGKVLHPQQSDSVGNTMEKNEFYGISCNRPRSKTDEKRTAPEPPRRHCSTNSIVANNSLDQICEDYDGMSISSQQTKSFNNSEIYSSNQMHSMQYYENNNCQILPAHQCHHQQQQQQPIYANYNAVVVNALQSQQQSLPNMQLPNHIQTRAEVHAEKIHFSHSNDSKSNSSIDSIDALPFANDNAGTIKQRANQYHQITHSSPNISLENNESPITSVPKPQNQLTQSTVAAVAASDGCLKSINDVNAFNSNCNLNFSPINLSSISNANGTDDVNDVDGSRTSVNTSLVVDTSRDPNTATIDSNVLNDIGNMLANLTDELDAMLEEEKRVGLNDSE